MKKVDSFSPARMIIMIIAAFTACFFPKEIFNEWIAGKKQLFSVMKERGLFAQHRLFDNKTVIRTIMSLAK